MMIGEVKEKNFSRKWLHGECSQNTTASVNDKGRNANIIAQGEPENRREGYGKRNQSIQARTWTAGNQVGTVKQSIHTSWSTGEESTNREYLVNSFSFEEAC